MSIIADEKQSMLSTRMEAAAGGPLLSSSPTAKSVALPLERSSSERVPRVITTRPQLAISDQELRARVQWLHKTSSHFQLAYDRVAFADAQARTLLETLEEAYSLVFHFTHESFTDRFQVFAVDQRATSLLGRAVRSHFNFQERAIYLAQTSSQNIYSELIEHVTHAMRIARYAKHYGHTPGWAALEEAFSVFLNERLSISPDVFPFYSADADLIANHVYATHPESLANLWGTPSFQALNFYQMVLTGAFFLHLGDIYSDDRIATLSKSDYAITSETFRAFFGVTLEALEEAWRRHLPVAQIALTQEEQDAMLTKWQRSIECQTH
jgi:hypothetical protein